MPLTQIAPDLSFTHWSQVLEEIYQGRQAHQFRGGINVPLYSGDIWIVYRGIIQLSTLHCDGNRAILSLVYPEMPFGLPLTQIEPYVATTLSDAVLIRISQRELEQSPILAQGILLQLNRRLQLAGTLLALAHHHHVSDRLQELLLLLTTEVGEQTPDGMRLGIRLTHQQIADLIGAARVTTTRIFGLLRKKGWLSIDKTRHIVIHQSAIFDLN